MEVRTTRQPMAHSQGPVWQSKWHSVRFQVPKQLKSCQDVIRITYMGREMWNTSHHMLYIFCVIQSQPPLTKAGTEQKLSLSITHPSTHLSHLGWMECYYSAGNHSQLSQPLLRWNCLIFHDGKLFWPPWKMEQMDFPGDCCCCFIKR